MIAFPSSFPLPSASLVAEELANTVRTRMDSGTVRQRRRFGTEMLLVEVLWEFTDEEMALFIALHKYKLNLGSDWFTMLLPLGGGVQTHTVRLVDGKFSQRYVEVSNWEVTAKLDVLERATYSEDTLDIYLHIGTSETDVTNFLEALNSFHECIHQTFPVNLN